MKRIFDLFLLTCLLPVVLPLFIIVSIIVLSTDGLPILYWSNRVGKNNKIFKMPKFRTMKRDTPQLATHLLEGRKYLISVGRILRKLSLDEIPQIWSILEGEMTFVGPRPALFNQEDLINQRTEKGVHQLTPGLTGWAQVNGRDEISIVQKVQLDYDYLKKKSLLFDIKILFLTFLKVISRKGITH